MTGQYVVEVHPAAAAEAKAAERWYRERSENAATRFRGELGRAIDLIAEAPQRWPLYEANTRRLVLNRFPFFLVYRSQGSRIEIVAIAHARREPGSWRDR